MSDELACDVDAPGISTPAPPLLAPPAVEPAETALDRDTFIVKIERRLGNWTSQGEDAPTNGIRQVATLADKR